MRIAGDNEKLQKFAGEVKEFEEQTYERHRRQMQEELRTFLVQKDRKAVQELEQCGHFQSKGFVSRTALTSIGKVRIRVHR